MVKRLIKPIAARWPIRNRIHLTERSPSDDGVRRFDGERTKKPPCDDARSCKTVPTTHINERAMPP
jgi:hypothetical protein